MCLKEEVRTVLLGGAAVGQPEMVLVDALTAPGYLPLSCDSLLVTYNNA